MSLWYFSCWFSTILFLRWIPQKCCWACVTLLTWHKVTTMFECKNCLKGFNKYESLSESSSKMLTLYLYLSFGGVTTLHLLTLTFTKFGEFKPGILCWLWEVKLTLWWTDILCWPQKVLLTLCPTLQTCQ